MVKPEWGAKRKCLQCGATFYDFRKVPPVCPKCGTIFEKKEVVAELEAEKEDIPKNADEIVVEDIETMEGEEYSELDVEEDMINVDPNLVNDDDIDNVFVENSADLEGEIHESMGTMEDETF